MPNYNGKEITTFDTSTGAPEASGASVSLFNAFYVFKYSGGVDKINPSTYVSNNLSNRNGARPDVISNPTASAIVDWAKSIPKNSKTGDFGVQNSPYTWSDFLFCKWYGIIPNNRLITLRKFPLATKDDASLDVKGEDTSVQTQNIPVAQAVTWFGGPTGNDLNKMWQSTWSIPWLKKPIEGKEVQGQEIVNFSDALLEILPPDTNQFFKAIIKNLAIQADLGYDNTNPNGRLASIAKGEIEQKQQEYLKGLWSDNGAFFNQIQGPVNVKNQFLIRDRGLSSAAPDAQWEIVFEYRTDSYFGMNQRRVGLDIIANMLNLTYSDGDWLKSLNVYYKRVGIAIGSDEQNKIEAALTNGGLDAIALAKAFQDIAVTRAAKIVELGVNLAQETTGALVDAGTDLLSGRGLASLNPKNLTAAQRTTLTTAIEVEVVKALAKSFPGFVQQRAAVADIPTGNWHLTIGNPMNPIMRIGNIVVRECKLEFGEELGPDDFPIELKFTVKVSPVKPRDGEELRKTFNNGRGDFINNFEGHTWDKANSYGKLNKGMILYAQGSEISTGANQNVPKVSQNNERINASANWLNTRYGEKMVDTSIFSKIWFYQPPLPEETGGSGTNNQPNPGG